MRKVLRVTALTAAVLVLLLVALAWLAPGPAYRAAMTFERRAAGLTLESVAVEGQRWSLLRGGAAQGEVLLLLHGFAADKDNWVRIAGELSGRFRLLIPDLPGFGDSDPVAGADYEVEAQADRVGRLLDALGIRKLSVGGSSMGGYIALALARQRPAQVVSLWLLAPAGVSAAPLSDMMEQIAGGGPNPLIPEQASAFDQTLAFVFERRPFIPWPVRRYLGRRQVALRERYLEIFDDLRYRSPPAERLADGLAQPALIVWGSADRVLHPAGAEELARVMARAQVELMPGLGHLPMIEDPAATAAAFLAWRDEAAAQR